MPLYSPRLYCLPCMKLLLTSMRVCDPSCIPLWTYAAWTTNNWLNWNCNSSIYHWVVLAHCSYNSHHTLYHVANNDLNFVKLTSPFRYCHNTMAEHTSLKRVSVSPNSQNTHFSRMNNGHSAMGDHVLVCTGTNMLVCRLQNEYLTGNSHT